jgi:hypothetical protein
MNERLRFAEHIGNLYIQDIDWYFRVYRMLGDPSEVVEQSTLFSNLERKARIVVSQYLSDEYEYMRTGFILAHYGHRGVTHSIWHWADWVGTWEYFCQAWYCYGRAVDKMVALDRIEPILCQHEIEIVMAEALHFRNIAFSGAAHKDIISEYRNSGPEISKPQVLGAHAGASTAQNP